MLWAVIARVKYQSWSKLVGVFESEDLAKSAARDTLAREPEVFIVVSECELNTNVNGIGARYFRSKTYHSARTLEGFGCTSHEEKELTLGMVGECTRSYLKQEKSREQLIYQLIETAQQLEGLPPDYSGHEEEWLRKFADAGKLAEQLLHEEEEDGNV